MGRWHSRLAQISHKDSVLGSSPRRPTNFTMCKENRALTIAAKAAEQSGHDTFRHGAVLIKGGSVINVAANKYNHTSFGQRFRERPGPATHHAELACILGIERGTTNGATIYVSRINKTGGWKMSKPCDMCHEALKFVGIKKVVYTTGEGEWESYKLNEEEDDE